MKSYLYYERYLNKDTVRWENVEKYLVRKELTTFSRYLFLRKNFIVDVRLSSKYASVHWKTHQNMRIENVGFQTLTYMVERWLRKWWWNLKAENFREFELWISKSTFIKHLTLAQQNVSAHVGLKVT